MTCSAAKHEANRANSIHSTGPRTEDGKAASSRNSLSHGLTATFPVILPGEQPEFDSLREGLYLSIRPEGTLEDVFFSRLVHATWNLRRCDLIEVSIAPAADPLASSDDTAQQRAVNVDLYRNRAERTLYRCTKELRLLQSERSTREFAAARENPIPAIAVEVVPPMANLVLTNQFSKPRPGALFRDGRLDWEFGERRIAERRERLEAEAQAAVDQAAEMREDAAAESESEPNEAMEPAPVCTTYRREGPKTGRNEPCPCGSGAKFKRCCGR